MDILKNRIWQAKEYNENSEVQKKAAMHVLHLLQLTGCETLLDVGCGDGKITAAIADLLPQGTVLGTDACQEMISFASSKFLPRPRPNLTFMLQGAEELNYDNQFDVVFSSFVLQWVLNVDEFFKRAYHSLKPLGRIGCTIPLGISDELEEALAFLTKQPQWNDYFAAFELNYYLRDENEFEKLLSLHGFSPTHFEVINEDWVFPSRKSFEQYTLLWLPHLSAIPESLQGEFFRQLINKYIELTPKLENGRVSFRFARIDFIAKKSTIV